MITIGVAIPCYVHHISKLSSVFDSILQQTVKPDHVVVSCSSTNSDNVQIAQLIEKYSPLFRLDIILTTDRKNAAENRNIASRFLETDIISYMDADDMMYPMRLEIIIKAFQNTDCKIVLHSYDIGDNPNNVQLECGMEYGIEYGKLIRAPSGCALHSENHYAKIHHAHSSISREIINSIQYREEMEYARREDSLFCGDVLSYVQSKNVYIPQSLSIYFEEGQTIL